MPRKNLKHFSFQLSEPAVLNGVDLVADFFCGSGTTLAVAEKLGRRWIGCDLGRFAVHTTRKRLLGIDGCKPFEILNLGKYERQYWQGVTFGAQGKNITEQALYEYLAFILKLYGAQPLVGLAHLHGKNGKAMVHIGAVDAPVTIDEINAAVAECVQVRQAELHVLGWEWEMGLYDLMVAEAKRQGVKLLLLQIPREVMEQQAVDKGDIQFFELAYLEVEIGRPRKLTATVILKDFVIPNTELIPEEVRSKVQKMVRLHRLLGSGLAFPERHLHAGLGSLPHAQGAQAAPHLRPAYLRQARTLPGAGQSRGYFRQRHLTGV